MNFAFKHYVKAVKAVCWKIIERLAPANYYSAKAFYMLQLHRKSRRHREPPLLIYQMGKVGSKTVWTSLQALKLDMPIYHIHHLSHDFISSRQEKNKKYFYQRTPHYNYETLWKYEYLRKQLRKGLNGKKWKIVTLTRGPIAVNVSQFFYHFKEVQTLEADNHYKIKSIYFDLEYTLRLGDINDLDFLGLKFLENVNHDGPLRFFDDELKNVFGIDVFASEFPKSKGYKIYEGESADVLLIRLENLKECACDAFKEFLNIEGVTLINTNIGSEKDYNVIYQAFKDSAVLPNWYIDKMYRSKYIQHFYCEEEIKRFKAGWLTPRNSDDNKLSAKRQGKEGAYIYR